MFQAAYKSRFLLLGAEMHVKCLAYSLSGHSYREADRYYREQRDLAPRGSKYMRNVYRFKQSI